MKQFIVRPWGPIGEIEVERESDSFVWIKGRRAKKRTSYECIFSSYDAAKQHRIQLAKNLVNEAKSAMTRAQSILAEANAL